MLGPMVVFDPIIVWTHYLLNPTCFDPTLFGPNVYDPTFFKKPKLLLTNIFHQIILIKKQNYLPKYLWFKFCFDTFFSKLTIFGPKIFLTNDLTIPKVLQKP